jgi:hypothetical protein
MTDYSSSGRHYELAQLRMREAHVEAAELRCARQLAPANSPRRRLGLWLIALGERLAGSAAQSAPASVRAA